MNEDLNKKPVSHRRKGRSRPTLVTGAEMDVQPQDAGDTQQAPTATAEAPAPDAPVEKHRPRFFSTLGRKEADKEKETEAAEARIARATRGKGASTPKKAVEEPKKVSGETKSARSAPARPAGASRPGFKPKHLIGILVYLLVADFVGVYEKSILEANHLEKLLFTLGPVPIYVSTVFFLLTLVVLLIILARFDLVPRSLTPARQTPQSKTSSSRNDGSADGGRSPSSMKQGVQGKNDDLYQEYRQTQKYLQRRERKKS